jgi:hypothetical protein
VRWESRGRLTSSFKVELIVGLIRPKRLGKSYAEVMKFMIRENGVFTK